RESTQAADLDADRADVGESTKGEGSDGERARIEHGFLSTENREGDEFVQGHARTEQVSDQPTVVPGNPDEPGNWREDDAEDALQAGGEPGESVTGEEVVRAAEDAVKQRDKRQERDQHGHDVDRQSETVARTLGGGSEHVLLFLFLITMNLGHTAGFRNTGFRHQHLGDGQCAWRSHDDGGQQVLGLNPGCDVCSHDSAGDVSHAGGHDDHELGFSDARQEGANRKRRFSLAHEDTGRDVERFDTAHVHHAPHYDCGDIDDELHDAVVVEDCKERSNEDDGRRHLEREHETVRRFRLWQSDGSKDERRAFVRIGKQTIDAVAGAGDQVAAELPPEHEESKKDLQDDSGDYSAKLDGAAVRGDCPRYRQYDDQPED